MKKTRKLARLISMLAAGVMVAGALAGCSAKGGSTNSNTPTDKKEAPTEISIMSLFWTQEPPSEDNPILKEIEKRTNTKLKISWVTSNNFQDKRNVTLASGDIPDLMFIDDPYAPVVQGMETQGAFWDISPYLKDYKNLMKFPETTWKYIKSPDGKIYGIPRVRPTDGNQTLMLRQDWLDKLQLKMPSTTDELYTVLKAFTEKDPDGNGQNDTVGLTGNVNQNDLNNFNIIEGAFTGSPTCWVVKNGKLVDTTLEPEQRDALVYLNKLYKEGLLPKDLLVLKGTQAKDILLGGKAGSMVDGLNQAWRSTEELRKTNDKAGIVVAPYLQGPGGIKFAARGSGSYGKYVIPRKVPENKMKKILEFMDYGASDEGSDLANYGVKDVHYTEKDGFKISNDQGKKDNVSSDTFGQIFNKFDKYFRAIAAPTTPKERVEVYKKVIDEAAKVSAENPATGLYSETNVKVGAEIRKKINDMKLKIISGKEPITAWDDFVNKMKTDADFQKIIKEMSDAYSKRAAAK